MPILDKLAGAMERATAVLRAAGGNYQNVMAPVPMVAAPAGSNPSELPAAPPEAAEYSPLYARRLGLEVYQNYWSAFPADVRRLLGLMSGWYDVCVRILGEEAANLPILAYTQDPGDLQRTKKPLDLSSWVPNVLDNPTPGEWTPQEWHELFFRWLYYTGNVFIFTPTWGQDAQAGEVPGGQEDWEGMPARLEILETSRVYVVADANRLVRYYVYFSNSGPRFFAPEEICHVKVAYPSDDPVQHRLWGRAPLISALQAVGSSANLQAYISEFAENFGMPPVIVTKENGRWTDTEKAAYEKAWNAKFRQGGGKIGFSEAKGVKIEAPVDTTANFKGLYEVNQSAAEEICAHVGVTLGRVLGKFQNKSTSETVRDDFNTGPLRAKLRLRDQALTGHFRLYQRGVLVEHQPPMGEDRDQDRAEELFLLGSGALTPNQLAERHGIEAENPEGDRYFMASNLVEYSKAIAPTPAPAAAAFAVGKAQRRTKAEAGKEDDGDGFNRADTDYEAWKALDNIRKKGTRQIEQGVARAFDSLRPEVLGNARKSYSGGRLVWRSEDGGPENTAEAGALFDVEAFREKLVKECGEAVADLISETLAQAVKDAGGAPPESDWEKLIDKAVDRSIDKITTCADTVKDELRALLQSMKDESEAAVTEAIKAKFDQYGDSGAARIATTTTTYSQGATVKGVHKELGLRSQWMNLRLSASPRSTHLAAHKQVCDAAGLFHIKNAETGNIDAIEHPGAGPAEQAINCRCQIKATRATQ